MESQHWNALMVVIDHLCKYYRPREWVAKWLVQIADEPSAAKSNVDDK